MPRPQSDPRTASYAAKHEPVDPIWLLKGVGLMLIASLACGYIALCVLFYQGRWQLVLHPTRRTSRPTSIAGMPYEFVRFGPDESAIPQLTGWWIPAAPAPRYPQAVILCLPGANGSLADSASTLEALHSVGADIFAFDYRGYGQSAAIRPNQQSMVHDASSAWRYLVTSRSVPADRIVLYGVGIGASLATHLALMHSSDAALILDSPNGDLLDQARRDPRSRFLPVDLLFHDRFPLTQPLSIVRTPKLLFSRSAADEKVFDRAAAPKLVVTLTPSSEVLYEQTILRFLNEHLSPPVPSGAPHS